MFKIAAGILGAVLMIAYVAPVVYRLKEISLSVVVALGVGMMLVDLWQSFQSKED
jgi:hypothetical protein